MRICFITAEMAPFAKAGGLADVSGALLKYLHAAGHDLRLFMPAHSVIDRGGLEVHPVSFMQTQRQPVGAQQYEYSLLTARLPGTEAWCYLVDCPAAFARDAIYTTAPDEHRRFLLLTHAAFVACQHMSFAPQILHCNDWHTAIAPLWLRSIYRWDRLFAATRSVLTIHNLGYQGVLNAGAAPEVMPATDRQLLHQQDLAAGRINLLRHGVLYADAITTVSPTYAREITTPAQGMGLDADLRARGAALSGILNGVDYSEWDPRNDPFLPRRYSPRQLGGKADLKRQLLERLGLVAGAGRPLFGIVSRLAAQKGFDLLFDVLPSLLVERDFTLAVLGSGEPRYEQFFAELQRRLPQRVHFHRGYSEELAHWIEAASDMFLMPSAYEPCGLNQMYSLRYGTVPIVRRTGGLADTVRLFDEASGVGTGILFNDYNAEAVRWALHYALDLYARPEKWKTLMRNGMAEDFSWQRRVGDYVELYERLAG